MSAPKLTEAQRVLFAMMPIEVPCFAEDLDAEVVAGNLYVASSPNGKTYYLTDAGLAALKGNDR